MTKTLVRWKDAKAEGACLAEASEIDVGTVTVAVCGGGNGAHAAAAMYAHIGAKVKMFLSLPREADAISKGVAEMGGIRVVQHNSDLTELDYRAAPHVITQDARVAVHDADVVILFAPGFAHEAILKQIGPFLKPGVCVGSVPAAGGFDLLARHVLHQAGCDLQQITLFGSISLPWACRIHEYGKEVHILGTKQELPFSAHPNVPPVPLEELLTALHIGTRFKLGHAFLETTLWPANPIIHPGMMYGQWKDWDGEPVKDAPMFYRGCTELAERVLSQMSDEIGKTASALSSALGVSLQVPGLDGFMLQSYGHEIEDKSSLRRMFQTNPAYAGLKHPCKPAKQEGFVVPDFHHRYITEDLPHGLVVLRGLAELAQVPTPAMDEVLTWCQEKCGSEYLVGGSICGADVCTTGAPQRFGIKEVSVLMSTSPI
mmetsp:Transcript_9661/g.20385  ORF Transcript_9661/g.20385 Transcript_9661/m.20385 type:complete len:429 (+) Transcript_9661:55-1341(+)|eukprot:CAMPEP_0185846664 /NCGR_PEP_ID=MMETSP1354-20130828/2223_1 /TAXON_ID=708628 /ORGANISM="Erythrolobus madagascarensis, Strain CCMP3276" /LENGTH=428 /DNA_ID=CAMNT_0028546843 /DNA_START=41 /DNA_END=1327 /DNA_ORIENTATION=+